MPLALFDLQHLDSREKGFVKKIEKKKLFLRRAYVIIIKKNLAQLALPFHIHTSVAPFLSHQKKTNIQRAIASKKRHFEILFFFNRAIFQNGTDCPKRGKRGKLG